MKHLQHLDLVLAVHSANRIVTAGAFPVPLSLGRIDLRPVQPLARHDHPAAVQDLHQGSAHGVVVDQPGERAVDGEERIAPAGVGRKRYQAESLVGGGQLQLVEALGQLHGRFEHVPGRELRLARRNGLVAVVADRVLQRRGRLARLHAPPQDRTAIRDDEEAVDVHGSQRCRGCRVHRGHRKHEKKSPFHRSDSRHHALRWC